jgi:hypothetical protein
VLDLVFGVDYRSVQAWYTGKPRSFVIDLPWRLLVPFLSAC